MGEVVQTSLDYHVFASIAGQADVDDSSPPSSSPPVMISSHIRTGPRGRRCSVHSKSKRTGPRYTRPTATGKNFAVAEAQAAHAVAELEAPRERTAHARGLTDMPWGIKTAGNS